MWKILKRMSGLIKNTRVFVSAAQNHMYQSRQLMLPLESVSMLAAFDEYLAYVAKRIPGAVKALNQAYTLNYGSVE